MRRATGIGIALALAAAALAGCGGSGDYRVDAIFDNASFLTPGTDVRIAGAKAGSVVALELTPDHRARIELAVDRRFAPFHADADCTIQPQSLISEKFVNCTPGTPAAPALRKPPSGAPVLSVAHTHAPVDLDLVLNVFRLPVRERLSLLLDSLGGGLAARGDDLNHAILRAAPALEQARRVLAILDRDRGELRSLVGNSDVVLRQLAAGRGRLAAFLRDAGVVADTSGRRAEAVREAVHRLPGLLARARPAFATLTTFAHAGLPVMRELRTAAPGVTRLVDSIGPFSRRALPGVLALGTTARRVTPQIRVIAPQVTRLRTFAHWALPTGALLATLSRSLRSEGVVEGVSNIFYYGAAATARFDAHSHMLPAHILASTCLLWTTTPDPSCDAHYPSFTGSPAARAARRRAVARRNPHPVPAVASRPAPSVPATPAPAAAAPPAATPVPSTNTVDTLLKFLLG